MKNKLYKILGAVLSVCIVLTAIFCLSAVAENAVDEVIVKDYYVQSPGYQAIEAEGYETASKGAGTIDNPAHTVADLIDIIGDELTANDTANVYILQREDWKANNGTRFGDYTAEDGTQVLDNAPRSSITAWALNGGAVASHEYTLVLRSPEGQQNFLAYTAYIGKSADVVLGGPTVFENVILLDTETNNNTSISHVGKDVSFGEDTKFHFIAKINTTNSAAWTGDTTFRDSWPIRYGYKKDVGGDGKGNFGGSTITIKSPIKPGNSTWVAKRRLFIGIGQGSNININGDFTVVLDNKDMELPINWGNNANNYNKPTFARTVNFNIKSAKSVSHNLYVASGKTYYNGVQINGGLQVIMPEGFEFDPTLIGPDKNGAYRDCVVGDRYIIERISNDPDIIDFAKDANDNVIAGTYTIKLGYTATATTKVYETTVNSETGEYTKTLKETVTNVSKNGLLTVPAGETTVTFVKGAITKDYYVRSPGWQDLDDGEYNKGLGTKESPAATVADVIDIINTDGLVAGDTANVYIMNNSDVTDADLTKRYDGSVVGYEDVDGNRVFHIPYHSLTSWQHTQKNISSGGDTPSAHTFKMVIKADPQATGDVYLAYADTIGNGALKLSGPTVFENVTIVSPRSYWNSIIAGGNDMTYGANCKFAGIPMDYSDKYSDGKTWDGSLSSYNAVNTYLLPNTNNLTFDGMNFVINGKYQSGYARMLYLTYSKRNATFTGDYNITVDSDTASPQLYWGIKDDTASLTLTNLNIYVKQGKLTNVVADNANNTITAGAVQVIAEKDATVIDLETVLAAKNLTKYYYIKNTGDSGILSFRLGEDGNAIAGSFNVADGYNVTAVNTTTGEKVNSKDGVLNLEGNYGTYTIIFEEAESHNYDDYINYRNGLGNTYSKLSKDNQLNVVYFGGSVTAGSGSSDASMYSWRARVGNWLTSSFPTANISNISQAIGETGTYLGCYRVARDVVSKAPDLLFIEYSINDYYDGNNYDRSQMQFETIVRQVKAKYPNCDIVTILVTSYGNINLARQNKLHTAAQAHEDICNKYNIPSIYVGGALAESFGETWTKQDGYKNDATWLEYIKDDVHPTDKGYEIYFNVIKEFLNNELNYGEYDGTVKVNPMPEIQNNYKYLFDGDITYIDESTVAFTTEGGTTYNPESEGIVSKEDYQGLIFVPAGSKDTLTVNFTGTELIMVTTGGHGKTVEITTTDSAYTENDDINKDKDGIQISVRNTFEVSLDGGKTWTTNYYAGKNPIVIAAGLSAGSHTAVIRPSSYAQTRIAGFYSRDVEKSSNILNILDLVNADEQITASTTKSYFDYNNDDVIDVKDLATLKKILLNK